MESKVTKTAPRFATAINCMDGRVQIPVIEHMKALYKVDHIDMITEPGPIKILSQSGEMATIESIKKRAEISVLVHRSDIIAVVAHYDCAGNPAGKDVQRKQLHSAIKTVKAWLFRAQVIGLWVDKKWEVFEVDMEQE